MLLRSAQDADGPELAIQAGTTSVIQACEGPEWRWCSPSTGTSATRRVESAGRANPAGAERRTTPVELFWDLAFVFAITQVTHFLLFHLTWVGSCEGWSSWH